MSDGDEATVGRGPATEAEGTDRGGPFPPLDDPTREAIAARIREYAAELERREREEALEKLRARGEVTDAQREAIEEMTAGILDGLLATPEAALREADDRALRAAMRVYGLDPGGDVGEGGDGDPRVTGAADDGHE